MGTFDVLQLQPSGTDDANFVSSFFHGNWGYVITGRGGFDKGRIVRFKLDDFQTIETLDLMAIDVDLRGFHGGFHDDKYGYCIPGEIRGTDSTKMVRFSLESFNAASVEVLDLAPKDAKLSHFAGGFQDGTYGYAVPHLHGKVLRFKLTDFTLNGMEVLDLPSSLNGIRFSGGAVFHDGEYGYAGAMADYSSGSWASTNLAVRFPLKDFNKVEVMDLAQASGNSFIYRPVGGFSAGNHAYFITSNYLVRVGTQSATTTSVTTTGTTTVSTSTTSTTTTTTQTSTTDTTTIAIFVDESSPRMAMLRWWVVLAVFSWMWLS